MIENKYLADVDAILSHINDNGSTLWTTPDKKIIKGDLFRLLNALHIY